MIRLRQWRDSSFRWPFLMGVTLAAFLLQGCSFSVNGVVFDADDDGRIVASDPYWIDGPSVKEERDRINRQSAGPVIVTTLAGVLVLAAQIGLGFLVYDLTSE